MIKISNFCGMMLLLSYCMVLNAFNDNEHLERLDSIIINDYWYKKKCEFFYDGQGQVECVLYYQWTEGDWSLTNKREYSYDEQGNDTLLTVFSRKGGQWLLERQRFSAYDAQGNRLQERTVSYVDGQNPSQSRWDFLYDGHGRQVSSSQYKEKQGVWQKAMVVQDEYDAGENLTREWYEHMDAYPTQKGLTLMHYDEAGRLVMQVDSVFDDVSKREWRRREFSYNVQGLCMVKETLTTIDHDEVQQRVDESLLDPQGNLMQTRRYKQEHGAWQHTSSVAYVYDLERDASSILGSGILTDVLGIEMKEQIHNKLLTRFNVEMDGKTCETRCFYSELSPISH